MHAQQPFTPHETLLYFWLVNRFNEDGTKRNWPVSLRLRNDELCPPDDGKEITKYGPAGFSLNGMKQARQQLVNRGLIGFEGVKNGDRKGLEYWLYDEHGQTERLSPPDSLLKQKLSGGDTKLKKDCQTVIVFWGKDWQVVTPTPIIANIKETFYSLTKRRESEGGKSLGPEGKKNGDEEVHEAAVVGATAAPAQPRRGDPFTRRTDAEACNVAFSVWYQVYDYDVGRDYVRTAWLDLTDEERQQAMDHTPLYVASRPEKRFRGYPLTYLSEKRFKDEIIDYGTSANRRNRRRDEGEGDTGEELDRLINGYYST